MLHTVSVSASTLLAVLLVAASTSYAQFDHLRCFKIKDSAKFKATATLTALQAQFGIDETCEIKGKGSLFCVPVSKTVTSFVDGSTDGIPQETLNGDELTFDTICYKIKCPKRDIAAELVTDQFGSRTVERFKSQYLCAPAIKGRPLTGTTTTLPTNGTTTTTTTTLSTACIDSQTQPCGSNVGECVEGIRVCQNGTFGSCIGGVGPTSEACDGRDNDCDGVVDNGFNLATDSSNCGSCSNVCAAPALCISGVCTDICSQIGVVCAPGRECVNLPGGSFECACLSGTTDCNGSCVDLSSDPSNCGACANSCGSIFNCLNGACCLQPAQSCNSNAECCSGQCTDLGFGGFCDF